MWTELFVSCLLGSVAISLAGTLVVAAFGRQATLRSIAAMLTLLALPALPTVLSLWSASAPARPALVFTPVLPEWPVWIPLVQRVWIAGTAVMLAKLLVELISLGAASRRLTPITDARILERWSAVGGGDGTRLVYGHSADLAGPAVWGTLRPMLCLPAEAVEWSDELLDVTLRHERAHIRRGDWAVQLLASVAVAFCWFNPLVYVLRRALKAEAEILCDRAALSGCVPPVAYAEYLLALATGVPARPQGHRLAIVSRQHLRPRIRAILEPDRFSGLHRLLGWTATVAAVFACVWVLSEVRSWRFLVPARVPLPTGALRPSVAPPSGDATLIPARTP